MQNLIYLQRLGKEKREMCRKRTGENHPNSKKVMDPLGRIFPSITACAKENGLTREHLSYLLNNKINRGGYSFISNK